jgi:FtsH-binding integral membrane protein
MAFAQSARPIEGAVATLGVSDRVDFLRKTYGLLGIALLAFAAITAGMMRYMTETSLKFSAWSFGGTGYNWLAVLAAFMVVGWVTQKMARSETSQGVQFLGLLLGVVAEAVILQPLLWVCIFRFGHVGGLAGDTSFELGLAGKIILEAAVVTLAIFAGLTLTVFVTKKDFSFMRGALMCCTFAALGIIVASILFGFSLGIVFVGAMILLMAGYILYQTSLVLSYFPPTAYVSAALMLFGTIATLFWYVLQLMMSLNRR